MLIRKYFILPVFLILSFSTMSFAANIACPQRINCKENKKLASCNPVDGSNYFYVLDGPEEYLLAGSYEFNYVLVKYGMPPRCLYTHNREVMIAVSATSEMLLKPDTVVRGNKWRKVYEGFMCGYPLSPMTAMDCPFKSP